MSKQTKYWLFALIGTLAVSAYPIYMGFRVIHDMVLFGTVAEYDFPKYIIPYTPIALGVLTAVAAMPLMFRFAGRHNTLAATGLALGTFFLSELLFESKVIVTTSVVTTLESWQMYMCYVPPEMYQTRQWTAIDVLMGEYSPTFKLHFYLISVVLVIGLVNCIYGFGRVVASGDRGRVKALALQSVSVALFLGLCILACFTAFFRDGELLVSPLSAFLMGLFFVVLGTTAGLWAGSFTLGRSRWAAVWLPAAVSGLVTLVMYIGEMFLLSGNLYRLGTGFLFDPLPGIVLAPVDLGIIALAAAVVYGICGLLDRGKQIN